MNEIDGIGIKEGNRASRLVTMLARYRYAVATVDQAAISLFNLALTFCLVRLLDAPAFGFVSLWMTVAVLVIDVQVPLVGLPLNVHVPGAADKAARVRLEEAVTTVNFGLVIAAVAAIVAVSLFWDGDWVPRGWLIGTAVPLFIGVGLRREYCRSLAYSRGDMVMLLLTDVPYLVITSACLLAMLLWPRHLAGIASAFLAMSFGGIASQLCLSIGAQLRRFALGRKGWAAAYGGIFGEVGWAMTGVVSTHLQVRSYVYLTTYLVGLAGVAALNAVGILFRPITTFLTAWSRSALPQLAAAFAEGRVAAIDRALLYGTAGAAAGSVGWCTTVWLMWGPIETHLFGHKYPDAELLLLPWAIVSCSVAIEQIPATMLQAARDFRFLAYVSLTCAPITAAATVVAILWRGYTWTMYGAALGQVVGLAIVVCRLYQVRQRLRARFAVAIARPADLTPGRPASDASAAQ